MKKTSIFFNGIVIVLCVAVLIELFYYFSQNSKNSLFSNTSVPSKTKQSFSVIAKEPTDKIGRTVLYQTSNSLLPNGTEGPGYSVGYFKEWRKVKDASSDKYLILTKPKTNEELVFHAILEESELDGKLSMFGFEDLTDTQSKLSLETALHFVGNIKDEYSKMGTLLKTGDAVVVYFIKRSTTGEHLSDADNNYYINWLIVRRQGAVLE